VAIDARYDTCAFGDMDNDGDLDLYVNGTVTGGTQYRDYLFRNTGSAFDDVTPPELGSPRSDHGAVWADFDLDGALDLALAGVQKDGMHWLLRNTPRTSDAARALNVRALDDRGRATLAGAEIAIVGKGGVRRSVRLVDAGSGYNAQSDAPVHIAVPGSGPVTLQLRAIRGGSRVVSSREVDPAMFRGRVLELRLERP
jgi:hypothetical protein